jgi:YVTN family beta-propeller protein
VVVIAACGGGGAAGPIDASTPDAAPPDAAVDAAPPDAAIDPMRALAATRFRANCASCHGQLGAGGHSWINEALAPWIAGHEPDRIRAAVRAGRLPHMPAFHVDEIDDELLDALAAYVNELPDGWLAPPAHDVVVTIRDEDPWMSPMQLRVEPGQVVRFQNQGATYHDVSQLEWVASHGMEGDASGQLGPDGVFFWRAPDEPRVYTFLCKDHPYMRGEIHVGLDPVAPVHTPTAPMGPPPVAGTGELWVAAQWQDRIGAPGDGIIHVIDAETWEDVALIPAGNNPHNPWFLEGEDVLVVTSWFDNHVTFIDANARAPIRDVIVGATAAHVMAPWGRDVIWVSIEGSHYIESLDATSWNVVPRRIMLSGNMPHGLGEGGGRLLVAHSMTDDASIVDLTIEQETALVPAGHYPLGAAVSPDGSVGFIGNCLDETVSIIDMGTATKMEDVPLAGCVVQIAVTPDGSRAVVAHGSMTAVIDVATRTVLADVQTGKGAHGVAIGPSQAGGDLAYVTHKFDDHVAVIDVETGVHLGDVPLTLTTSDKRAIVGVTDTGGQGIVWRSK